MLMLRNIKSNFWSLNQFSLHCNGIPMIHETQESKEGTFCLPLISGVHRFVDFSCGSDIPQANAVFLSICLTGAIEVGFSGKLKLEFAMAGIWKKPFGFGYLAFGNVLFGIGISRGLPFPSIGKNSLYLVLFYLLTFLVTGHEKVT